MIRGKHGRWLSLDMGLLSDTKNWGLRMHRECRKRFPRHRHQRKPLVSDSGMHQAHGRSIWQVWSSSKWTTEQKTVLWPRSYLRTCKCRLLRIHIHMRNAPHLGIGSARLMVWLSYWWVVNEAGSSLVLIKRSSAGIVRFSFVAKLAYYYTLPMITKHTGMSSVYFRWNRIINKVFTAHAKNRKK